MDQITQQDKINEIMDSFGFARMERVLRMFDVQWQLPDGKVGVPTEKLLRLTVRNSLNTICKEPIPEQSKDNWALNINNGPFHIRRYGGLKNKKAWEELSLVFIAENYSTEKQTSQAK
jgi:hypothetical protein